MARVPVSERGGRPAVVSGSSWKASRRRIHWACVPSDDVKRFAFRFTPPYQRAARLFGVTPAKAWVQIADGNLDAHFGPWRLRTPLVNIVAVEVTGPYAFLKTAGPPHLGITDRGLTFASNSERGVLMTFREPVPGIEPTGRLRHPELTVTVADVDGLASLLSEQTAT
jgi:hypothetical protein